MRQDYLDRAVAHATGDDFAIIHQRGFSIVDDTSALQDEDFAEFVHDWDRIQQEIVTHDHRGSHWKASVVRAPHARHSNARRQRRSRPAHLSRSTKVTN